MSFLRLNNFTLGQYLGAPFVWLKNYYDVLLNTASPMRIGIMGSIRNTIIYTIFVTTGQIGVGMLVALMINMDFKLRSLVRTLFLFSWIVPTYVTGILWGFMWQKSIGILNIIMYDLFKFHIIAAKLNPIITWLKLNYLVAALNKIIMGVQGIISIINNILNAAVNMFFGWLHVEPLTIFMGITVKIIVFILFVKLGIKVFQWINAKSKHASYWYVFIVISLLLLGAYKIQFPLVLSEQYKPFWLAGPNTIWAIIIPTIWRYWPLSMLMLLAALQSIPKSLYDAAKIDGANKWQTFWKITWPSLRPVWMILILFGMIYNVNSFNIVIMMFGNGAGFPGEWGDLMMTNIFRNSFMRWDFGIGAATSVLLLIVMIIAVNIWFKFYYKHEESFF